MNLALASKHPILKGSKFMYGTAGFRMNADLLDSVMFSVGLLAVLRSKSHKGKIIGAMITASHNPEADNGIKLVEPLGDMLDQQWEEYAIWLANAADGASLQDCIDKIVKAENIDISAPSSVIAGRDTRPSGEDLCKALQDGVHALGGKFEDYGLVTTPQLHYITRCLNTVSLPSSYGQPTVQGYYDKMASAYKRIVTERKTLPTPLHVDAANGIGAIALKELVEVIGSSVLPVEITNDDVKSKGVLNHECGADFVKMHQKAPIGGTTLQNGTRACSLDGDADRIVFYFAQDGKFHLLDGDKIAILAAGFIMSKIKISGVTHTDKSPLSVGLVQTAYANGNSTAYVKDVLKVPVVFTPTGVKHLHHEAAHFDVGVYFEANGHGTVLFSEKAVQAFHHTKGSTQEQESALEILRALSDLINQTVGDALSDMLMVEAILCCKDETFAQWNAGYTDLPSRQEKVKVSNRSLFVPINADTELIEPKGLQNIINDEVAKITKGRCFVRPSGTEDVVRVYAEAATVHETEVLAMRVCGIVFDKFGGVGIRPEKYK